MPSARRHPRNRSHPERPNLSPTPDRQTRTPEQAGSRESGPATDQGRPNRPSIARRLENVFQEQYYPHWVLIGLVPVLLAVGYQHGDVVSEFVAEICHHTWSYIGQTPSWTDAWLASGQHGIDRRSNLSLEEFQQTYDGKRPVLITDVLQDWAAIHWSKDFFLSRYSKHRVVMKAVQGSLEQAEGFSLPLGKFIEHLYDSSPSQWTYVEDELFIPNIPELKEDIGSSPYLEEDFFKLFPDEVRPWNAMFLWGTKYSRSSLHIDPYNWTGTNAVFRGMKRWKLYPPGQDDYLYVLHDRMSGFPLNCYKYNSPIDAFDPDWKKYPKFSKARAMEFIQYPGELLIIPSGWFHQAYNTKETIAVSGQVMNTANYRMVLEEIMKADNINLDLLPVNFDEMAPAEQVRAVVDSIPPRILDEGRKVNENVLNQIKRQPHEHT